MHTFQRIFEGEALKQKIKFVITAMLNGASRAAYSATHARSGDRFRDEIEVQNGAYWTQLSNSLEKSLQIIEVPSLDVYFREPDILTIMYDIFNLGDPMRTWPEDLLKYAVGNSQDLHNGLPGYKFDFENPE